MGIKDYHKWMRENHPNAFKNHWLNTYDHMYIDINFALHYCSYGTQNQGQILGKFFNFLDKIILQTYPTKSITIANDGPAPIAKLLLQRERRCNISNKEISNLDSSTLIFTPGTVFMNSIKDKIEVYIEKIKILLCIDVHYMLCCEGEAELKLKKKMMENIKENEHDTHIIISNDADIVAMFGTFSHNSFDKIFICCNVKENEILSMGNLMKSHINKYGKSDNYGLDFTFVSILLGNDYLPKINCVDLTKLWNSYKTWVDVYKTGIVDKKLNINTDFLIKICNSAIAKTQFRFFTNFTINDFKPALYKNYIEGVLWCLNMYNNGYCDEYNYMYEFDDTPNLIGVIYNLYNYENIAVMKNKKFPSINQNLYAILVFPQKAINLVDKKYHDFAKKNTILYEQEMCEECNNYHEKLDKLNSTQQEYKILSKELKLHKKKHPRIIVNDIEEIITSFTEEFDE